MLAALRNSAVALCAWACALGLAQADSAEELFEAAASQYRAEKWRESTAAFQRLIEEHPENPRSLSAEFYLAEALMQLDELTAAREHYQTLLTKDPNHKLARQALFRSGEAAWLQNQDTAARADLERFLERHPDDELREFVLPYLGAISFEAHEYQAAAQHYRAALESFPNGQLAAHSKLSLGRCLEKLGDAAQASELYQQLAGSGDGQYAPHALYRLGILAAQSNHFDQAAERFQQLVTNHSAHSIAVKAQLRLGHALLKLERPDDALKQLEPLVKEKGVGVEASYWGAVALKEKQDVQKAIDLLTAAIDQAGDHPLQPALHYELADCRAASGEFAEAEAVVKTLADRWPDSPYAGDAQQIIAAQSIRQGRAHLDAAVAFVKEGALDKALAELNSIKPGEDAVGADATYLRAQILEKQNRFDAALAAYYELFKPNAASSRVDAARFRAARLHQRLEQTNEATALYSILAEQPKSEHADDALHRLATIAQSAGNTAEARRGWQRLAKEHPQSALAADAMIALAKLEMEQEEFSEAQRLLSDASRLELAPLTRQRLLFQQGKLAFAQRRWSDVAEPLNKLCSEFPDSRLMLTAKYWVAEATYQQQDHEAAASQFAELQELAVNRSESWLPAIPLRRAQALAQQRRWTEALAVASQLRREHPNFDDMTEVDYLIGRCHAAQAEFEQARQAYDRVLSSKESAGSETTAMAQFMIGESHFHQEDFAAALRAYRKVDTHPFAQWQAAALLQSGKCLEQLGRSAEATQSYSNLLKRFPSSPVGEEARRRLDTARKHAPDGVRK